MKFPSYERAQQRSAAREKRRARRHTHTPGDGKLYRDVWLNGRLVGGAIYADERRGIVRVITEPTRLVRWGKKRILTRTLRGQVIVKPKYSEEIYAVILSTISARRKSK